MKKLAWLSVLLIVVGFMGTVALADSSPVANNQTVVVTGNNFGVVNGTLDCTMPAFGDNSWMQIALDGAVLPNTSAAPSSWAVSQADASLVRGTAITLSQNLGYQLLTGTFSPHISVARASMMLDVSSLSTNNGSGGAKLAGNKTNLVLTKTVTIKAPIQVITTMKT